MMAGATPDSVIAVELADRVVAARVRRSETGRTTRIRVGRDLPLQVVVPADASDESAASALRSKATWIVDKLDRIDRAVAEVSLLGLDDSNVAWHFGQRLAIASGPLRFARQQDDQLIVPSDRDLQAGAVRRWYRRTARRELGLLLAEEQERLGYHAAGLAVRDQRTRWGSCSRAGRVSLNWRLLIAPEPVARYVAIHELCHLRVPNHSRAFWRSVGRACPDWRTAVAWLSRHGDELRSFHPVR